MIDVATLAEMCQILKIDQTTVAKHWRKWPHFFATDGRDARSARFIPAQVVESLAKANGRLDVQDKERQKVQGDTVPRRGSGRVQARVRDKDGSQAVACGRRSAVAATHTSNTDRHGIFSRCHGVSQ